MNSRAPSLDENFHYLTDVRGGVFEGSIAIATRRSVVIITSVLESDIAKKSGCNVRAYSTSKNLENELKRATRGKKCIGINEGRISVASLKWLKKNLRGIKLSNISDELNRARMIKDDDEIRRIRKAGRIASAVAEEMKEILRVGMSEREAAAEIDYLMRLHGADGQAFETVVAFGSASALPHYLPGNRRLKQGSVVLMDFGALVDNYRSDITRTYLTKPKNRRIEEIYSVVLEAQKAAIREMKASRTGRDIDAAARSVIEEAGYGNNFIHSTGHGLGISVHDPGSLAKNSKDILRNDMVFTVEPGIYIPKLGGVRIEDNIQIATKKAKLLTTADRSLNVL